jgi:hypothetical protein
MMPRSSPVMNLHMSPHELERLWHHWRGRSDLPTVDRLVGFAAGVLACCQERSGGSSTPLEELELTMRSYNGLRRAGFDYVEDVQEMGLDDLLLIKGIGVGSAHEILEAIQLFKAARSILGTGKSTDTDQPVAAARRFNLGGLPSGGLAELLERSFYSMKEDRHRMAALLLQVSDLVSVHAGSDQVRKMALELMDDSQPAVI